MKELVVLDYAESCVNFYTISETDEVDDVYIENLGYNSNTCHWMVSKSIGVIKCKNI